MRGVKDVWITHLLGAKDGSTDACAHASADAISLATELRSAPNTSKAAAITGAPPVDNNKHDRAQTVTADTSSAAKKSKKQIDMSTYLFKGVNMPFNAAEIAAVEAQALRAVISGNLAFRAFEDPEMIKLLWML